jgi:hypothetical protein
MCILLCLAITPRFAEIGPRNIKRQNGYLLTLNVGISKSYTLTVARLIVGPHWHSLLHADFLKQTFHGLIK